MVALDIRGPDPFYGANQEKGVPSAVTSSLNYSVKIDAPYLLFLGDVATDIYAKTAQGLAHWCPEKCLGQLRTIESAADIGVPDMSIPEAAAAGARTLIVGVAPVGGRIKDSWLGVFREALEAGMDIAAGLHSRLNDVTELKTLADQLGRRLIDVRVPPVDLPVGSGVKRPGLRLMTVGTDCAIGKKWTALALARAMDARGMDATFRATGQTGIMIAGEGIPIDAVVSDFIAGAAELLSPDAAPDHWDVIEGQGSLFHPGYAAVTLGLIHGSQPDAFVVCHEAGRAEIEGFPGFAIPSVAECIDLTVANGRITNPDIRCVGIAVNTSTLEDGEAGAYLAAVQGQVGLPAVDPLRGGVDAIVDHIIAEFGETAL